MRRFCKICNLASASRYLSYYLYERLARFLPAVLLPLFTENPRRVLLGKTSGAGRQRKPAPVRNT